MGDYISMNIKYLREKKNLSQEAFAALVGGNRGNIDSYERGIAKPKDLIANNICKEFNITLDDLHNRDLRKLENEKNLSLGEKITPRKRGAANSAEAFDESEFDLIIASHEERFSNNGLTKSQRLAYRKIYTQTAPDDLMIYILSELDKRYNTQL